MATDVKKTDAKAVAPVKKEAAKKPAAKKVATKKVDVKTELIFEHYGAQMTDKDITKAAIKAFNKDNKKVVLKKIKVYVKPEDGKVYYVGNDDIVGSFDL